MEKREAGRPPGLIYPKRKLIRFTAEDAADITRLARGWRCTEAEAIRRAVREAAKREPSP